MTRDYLHSGESLSDAEILFDRTLCVDGGSAFSLSVFGELEVFQGGTAADTVISGFFDESEGECHGGTVTVMRGGCVSGTRVLGQLDDDRYSWSQSVFSGLLQVQGGIASDTAVEEFGTVTVTGGILENVSIEAFGKVTVSEGGCITGQIQIARGGTLSFDDGGVLDFDISGLSPGNDVLLNDFSLVKNIARAEIAISVDGTQPEGRYGLAGKASSFDMTVTVKAADDVLGSISLGNDLRSTKTKAVYSLVQADDGLWLNVSQYVPPEYILTTLPDGNSYLLQFTSEKDEHELEFGGGSRILNLKTENAEVRLLNLPSGEYELRIDGYDTPEKLSSRNSTIRLLQSEAETGTDFFFAKVSGTWTANYAARHEGIAADGLAGWEGTAETVPLQGKNIIDDVFRGGKAANALYLTDDENGDALFVEDIYSEVPEGMAIAQARLANLDCIYAGAGDDIVDLTSRKFAYVGDGIRVYGGSGDDNIWANQGNNWLFGDDGDDRLVGASGNDIIVGGAGNDSMHGGGGDDVFCFEVDWGQDDVEQLPDGTVTLWFASDDGHWDSENLTYRNGNNAVCVTGVSPENITLKFGDDGSDKYRELLASGALVSRPISS